MEGVSSVTLPAGTAVCGYADGAMAAEGDAAGGKTVAFSLREPDTNVFFEQQLWTVNELLASADVEGIAGHVVETGGDGAVAGVALDPEYDGPRFF
eukprot:6967129-Prymnesium_polylepis.1